MQASGTIRLTSLSDIQAARERIRGTVRRTPLVTLEAGTLYAKAESLQLTGSFKLRGAYNMLAGLTEAERARGVVTHSSGNHAQGVACAAHLLGVHATIVIPEGAPQVKVDRTASWGARIVRCGPSSEEREAVAGREAAEHGLILVPPFDHPSIIAGQGTAALEILEQLPEVTRVLVPVGGGGLIAGVSTAIKALRPDVRVTGVEPELGADAAESFATGKRVRWQASLTNRTIADGARTQQVGEHNLPLILQNVDDFVTVSEEAILSATRHYVHEAKLVVEPTGAMTLAAWRMLVESGQAGDGPAVVFVSGGNIDPRALATIAG